MKPSGISIPKDYINELRAFLRKFQELEDAELNLLLTPCKLKQFRKGEIMLAPGETQRDLYFILGGSQMSYFEQDGKTHVIAFTYAPGICAVPESFLFQSPSPCYLSCITDTQVLALSHDQLSKCFDAAPMIERLFRKLGEVVLSGFIKRHIELHALSMEQRFRSFCERSPQLLQSVPHKYIASYLGIDPTNFSKLFNSIKI